MDDPLLLNLTNDTYEINLIPAALVILNLVIHGFDSPQT